MKLTIPAREVKNGDRLPDLGLTITSTISYPFRDLGEEGGADVLVLYLEGGKAGSVHFENSDATVTVERDDPDEALIERIAVAIHAADHTNGAWDEYGDDERDDYLTFARAALAVVRADS